MKSIDCTDKKLVGAVAVLMAGMLMLILSYAAATKDATAYQSDVAQLETALADEQAKVEVSTQSKESQLQQRLDESITKVDSLNKELERLKTKNIELKTEVKIARRNKN